MSAFLAYFFAVILLLSALRTVTCTKPVHALLAMIIALLAISGLFFVIGAPFSAAVEVIVYAGAIMILFVFVLMMLNLGRETDIAEADLFDPKTWILPAAGAGLIFVIMVLALIKGTGHSADMLLSNTVDTKQIGILLYGSYWVLVEAGALLLLSALVAAYHIAKKEINDPEVVEECDDGQH